MHSQRHSGETASKQEQGGEVGGKAAGVRHEPGIRLDRTQRGRGQMRASREQAAPLGSGVRSQLGARLHRASRRIVHQGVMNE